MEKEIRITNELDEITALAIFVEEFCSDLSLPTETTMHINLALEEAVSNVIMYAYPLEEHHEIRLKASLTDNHLIFLLTDKGLSFDRPMPRMPISPFPLKNVPLADWVYS